MFLPIDVGNVLDGFKKTISLVIKPPEFLA